MAIQVEIISDGAIAQITKELKAELKKLFDDKQSEETWLKGSEVKSFLNCSEGTLVSLRAKRKTTLFQNRWYDLL